MLILNEFRLRLLDRNDLFFTKQLREDPETNKFLGTFCLLNDTRQEKWFESLQGDNSKCYMIFEKFIENQYTPIGLVRVTDIDYINRSMCVGGDIALPFRGNGYAKAMYSLIFEYGFNCMNMHRLYLLVLDDNLRAKNLYEKIGFKYEGVQRQAIYRKGSYTDYVMMSMLSHEYRKNTY